MSAGRTVRFAPGILAWLLFSAALAPAAEISILQPATFQMRGPLGDTNSFPIAVWLQDPKNAPRFKAAGINLYVGLWEGPTEAQLAGLKAAGL